MEHNGMEELRMLVARLERLVETLGAQQQANSRWEAMAKRWDARAARWEKDGGPHE